MLFIILLSTNNFILSISFGIPATIPLSSTPNINLPPPELRNAHTVARYFSPSLAGAKLSLNSICLPSNKFSFSPSKKRSGNISLILLFFSS